tara:strand:- start:473 stop:1210 length:738 start_codon:yes stop_codon:yes gene_type:complete
MPSTRSNASKKSEITESTVTETKKTKASKTDQKNTTTTATTATTAATTEPVIVKHETKAKKDTKDTKDTKQTKTVEQVTKEVENIVVNNDSIETSISDNFTEFITKFQAMISTFSTLKSELKVLERKTVKQLKIVQKLNNKKKRKGTRAPSGFVKPAPISNELAVFLGKPEGSEMARTDVTREINKYIRAHDLQDKTNGRKILPDKSLCDLLKIDSEVNLTYFNLQRYMGPHFPKKTDTANTSVN